MTKESLKLALEAAYLAGFKASGEGYNGEYGIDAPEQVAAWKKDRDNALREALAEQNECQHGVTDGCKECYMAQPQDSETVAQTFTGLPKRKLRELLSAGWQINGVCFQRTEEDGTVRRGAATVGGMVLWWNQGQPAQPQEEPVGEAYLCDACDTPFDGAYYCPSPTCGHNTSTKQPVYTSPPASKPLTDEQKLDLATNWFADDWAIKNALEMLNDYETICGIKEKKND